MDFLQAFASSICTQCLHHFWDNEVASFAFNNLSGSVLCACTTLAMFSATTLLAELKANEQPLEARNMDEKLAKGLTQQATYKLSKVNGLTSPDAVMLLDHLQASKLPTAMKDAIIQELDTLMVNAKGNIAARPTNI